MAEATTTVPLGATWREGDRTTFHVWAPSARAVEVVLEPDAEPRVVALDATTRGMYLADVPDVAPGTRYRYRLHRADGSHVDRADPASAWQPDGVEGPSAVDDPRFGWTDAAFRVPPLHRQVLYELHVGTFSPAGTFDGVVDALDDLAELGVTTLELLPVWQFPGARNWGYDGVLPWAVQDSYGGPAGLRRLVDAAHARGLAVVLDVVHNHVGPEGNHLGAFGPYFTDRHGTPWGEGINVDGPGADAVRRWIVDGAVRFVEAFHVDGFRLDAVHGIVDQSATHLLEELGAAVHAAGARLGKQVPLIAESDLSDARLIRHPERGGYGLDGQWADDFHHAVHVAVTGEQDGYYVDYRGLADYADQLRDRYVYAGRYSRHRDRTVGRAARDVPYDRFVVCVQNHDQVGNRMVGERLDALTDAAGCRFAAAAMLTSPFVPMLFMGEEHAEPAPFQFFVDHRDPQLLAAVADGRREEFSSFASWQGEVPDPTDPATFERSRIDRSLRTEGHHAQRYELYRELLRVRRELDLLTDPTAPDVVPSAVPGRQALVLSRRRGDEQVVTVLNADRRPLDVELPDALDGLTVVLDTDDPRFGGDGATSTPRVDDRVLRLTTAPSSVVLLHREPTP